MLASLVLIVAILMSLYILVGYPMLLAVWRRYGLPIRKDLGYTTPVTALLAVYNGEAFIERKLENLLALDYPAGLLDIVVISDGSTDGTDAIVQSFADRNVKLVRVPRGGKAAALNAGMKHATGEVLLFADVRQTFDPQALRHLVANFADPAVGGVTGELRFVHSDSVGEAADIDLYWRYEIWARQKHSQIDSIFNTTGCIYALRRKLAGPIPPDTLVDDAVIPLHAFFSGYRVVIDSEALAFDYGVISGGEFRRKMRTLGGVWQTWARMPRLFTSSDRMRMHFLAHKFGRLALPWIILVGLAATFAMPVGAVRTTVFTVTAVLLVLAGIDPLLPRQFPLRRISSPSRSFVVMNAASLLSVLVFVIPPERLWKPTSVAVGATDPLLAHQSQHKS